MAVQTTNPEIRRADRDTPKTELSIGPAQTFKERLLGQEQLMGAFLNTGSAALAEVCGFSGLDWGLIDLEHGVGGEPEMFAQVTALRASGSAAAVRVEAPNRIRIGRSLDAGAEAVMLPRCDSVEDVTGYLTHMRYPPAGDRGVAGYTRARRWGFDGKAHSSVDDEVAAIVQIESPAALAAVDEIAAVRGVAALFLGPSDLTAALGFPGQTEDPRFLEAVQELATACHNAGIAAGILSFTPDTVARYAELGYSLHAVGADANVWSRHCRKVAAAKVSSH